MIGSPARCDVRGNEIGANHIDQKLFDEVLEKIRNGQSFPILERQYQVAIGLDKERAMLLVLLAGTGPRSLRANSAASMSSLPPLFQAYVKLRKLG